MGQTISKTDSTGTANYTWDARGRLTSSTLPNGQTASYTYDPAGRRVSSSSGGVTTNYLYDGRNVVLDSRSDGTVTGYLNGPVLDEKLKQAQDGGNPMYFLQSQILSPAALLDSNGNILEQDQYEAFGKNAASSLTRYQFTGRELDSASNLLYYRARWYDPSQGRFLSEDPIGFKGGLDLYSYVWDDPVNLVDPLGRFPWLRSLCAVVGAGAGALIGDWVGGLAGAGVGAVAAGATGPGAVVDGPIFVGGGAAIGSSIGLPVGAVAGAAVGWVLCAKVPVACSKAEPRAEPSPSPSPSPDNGRTDSCAERQAAEQSWCVETFYRTSKKNLSLCFARAEWRFNNCVRGLPDPGPLDPRDPTWSQK